MIEVEEKSGKTVWHDLIAGLKALENYSVLLSPIKLDCNNGLGTLSRLFECLKKIVGLFKGEKISVLFIERNKTERQNHGIRKETGGFIEAVVRTPSGIFVLTADCSAFKYKSDGKVNFAVVEQNIRESIKAVPELQDLEFDFLEG